MNIVASLLFTMAVTTALLVIWLSIRRAFPEISALKEKRTEAMTDRSIAVSRLETRDPIEWPIDHYDMSKCGRDKVPA